MKSLQWAAITTLIWAAWVVLRLATATDIQNIVWWWVGLPIGFALPATVGWLLARHHFYKKEHHICLEGEHK